MYPASHSNFMSIDKPTVVQKRFFGNYRSELCFKTLKHLLSFLIASNEQVQNIEKSKASFVQVSIVFRHKDSVETIRCTYQVKLNQR